MKHYPLGQPIPDSVHAVCCSLPTLEDVVRYEEDDPNVRRHVKFAYPRFVFHEYVLRVMDHVSRTALPSGRRFYPTVSEHAAQRLVDYAAPEAGRVFDGDGLTGADLPDTPTTFQAAKSYLQHAGVCLSSRAAERYLVTQGLLAVTQAEDRADSDAANAQALAPLVHPANPLLSSSGMNAVHAALVAAAQVQLPRGRNRFVQLGWLYLDTQEVLAKLLPPGAAITVISDVTDKPAIEALFRAHESEIAAIVTEVPTNPLLQVPDLEHLRQLCEREEVIRIVDPSLAGVVNLDILPWCDVLVTSLTKYAAHCGDVMMGLLALNPASRFAAELEPLIQANLEVPDEADRLRLAAQITEMEAVADRVNANTKIIANWLGQQSSIARLHRPGEAALAPYLRAGKGAGGILTLELAGPMSAFYNACPIVKGPSFGTTFTMMCPFLYLAHYELVTSKKGREHLWANGLNPELIRLSIGAEPVEAIRAALQTGFRQ